VDQILETNKSLFFQSPTQTLQATQIFNSLSAARFITCLFH